MNEHANTPAKWLRYLLYVEIAALAATLLGYTPLPGSLSRWLSIALSAAAVYLLYRLADSNLRYRKAAVFSGAVLVCGLFNLRILILAASVCGIVAQYQEYHSHSELVADRDAKLAGRWSSLFWLQFVVSLGLGLVVSAITVAISLAGDLDTATTAFISTAAISVSSIVLQVLYLLYLHRTIQLVETEFVV